MNKLILIIFFLAFTSNILAQTYDTVFYKGEKYFTMFYDTFFSPTFTIPDSLPDAQWLILTKSSIPRYIFNTRENNIHGSFKEYENGFIRSEGNYYRDSLWTFRFSTSDDNRFKEGQWTYSLFVIGSGTIVGVEAKWIKSENLWYSNGTKKYETRDGRERWFYSNGSLQRTLSINEIINGQIINENFFDEFGNRNKFISTKSKFIKNVPRTEVLVCRNTIQYNGPFKIKESIEDGKYITTIIYGDVGNEINRKRKKKKKKR